MLAGHQVRQRAPPDGSYQGIDGRSEYVAQACQASLRPLGVDTIDLYVQHRVDRITPIEETVAALAEQWDDRHLSFSL